MLSGQNCIVYEYEKLLLAMSAYTWSVQVQASQNVNMKEGGRHIVPSLANEILLIIVS